MYGAVATKDANGVWSVDARETALQRLEIRRQRLARSIPTQEWMKEERERILTKNASVQVQHMFATSFACRPSSSSSSGTSGRCPRPGR